MRETVFASVLVLSCAAFGMAASREAPARESDDLLQGYAERAVREAAEKAAATRAAWEKAALETAEQAAKAAAEDLVKPAAEKAAATAAASAAEAAAKAAAEQTAKALTDEKAAKEELKAAKEELKAAEEKEKAERIAALSRIETRIFKLNHASSAEVAESFNSMWSGDFGTNWKVTKMAVAFPESNAIMVTAPRIILDACEKSIGELDVEAQQVYIEARFVELSNNASHKLGIDWSMLDGMKGGLSLNAGWNERKMEGVTSYNSATGDYTIDTSKNANKSTANLSYIKQRNTFELINNMEFLNDRYAQLMLSWDLDGKLFNRIPLLKRLKWREYLACHMLWGTLTDRNNPLLERNAGDGQLFYFPGNFDKDGNYQYLSRTMDPKKPYVEVVAGIHNIFKLVHVEYVHRLTYLDQPDTSRSGIRLRVMMSF